MLIDIPSDLVRDVVSAIRHQSDSYRRDKGHDPEDVAKLMADADRLDDLATEIERREDRMDYDARSAGDCMSDLAEALCRLHRLASKREA